MSAMERGKRGHKMDHKLLKYMSKKNADMGEARVVENPEKNAAVFDGLIAHYRGFWDIWPGNCMGVKTSEMGCFTLSLATIKQVSKSFFKKVKFYRKFP